MITINQLTFLLQGAMGTVQVFVFSVILALILGFIIGMTRLSKSKILSKLAMCYVEFFRGNSVIILLFWLYFVLPMFEIRLPAVLSGVIALSLVYSSYSAEIVRGAILAIPKGQLEAGIALNFTPWQRMKTIILPQAIRIMLPGFGNKWIELLKATSYVSMVTVADLTYQANILVHSGGNQANVYVMLLIVYFILALPLIITTRWFERRMSRGGI